MDKLKKIFFVALASFFLVGCVHAQVAVSKGQVVVLTWTPPPGCNTGTPCPSAVISRAQVATATTPCPANTGNSYVQVGTATTANAATFTDATVAATGYYCHIVQEQQGTPLLTGAPSAPSNTGTATAVTEPPGAPTTATTTAQ